MEDIVKKNLKYIIYTLMLILTFNIALGAEKEIKLSIAGSLEPVIKEVIEEYKKDIQNKDINFITNYGGSGSLRKQIENGSDTDIVFFADKENFEILKEKKLISDEELSFKIYNSLILVGNKQIISISEINKEKVAIGDPLTVPAGKYAMNYLKSEGYEDKLKENLVYGKEVRVVTNYFNLGEVDFAIIYKTELEKIKGNYYTLSLNTKNKIEYSSGILLGRDSENVKKFYKFFETDKAKDIFKKAGYILSN